MIFFKIITDNKTQTGLKTRLCFLLAIVLLMVACNASSVRAQMNTDDDAAVMQEVEKLRALKQQDPQAYQDYVQQKKEKLKKHVEKLKQNEPRYQAFVEKEQGFKKERLERMKNRRPETFQKYMSGRAERLEKMAEKNPERFDQIKNNRPRVREWHEKRRMNRRGEQPFTENRPRMNGEGQNAAREFPPQTNKFEERKHEGLRDPNQNQPQQKFEHRQQRQDAVERSLPAERQMGRGFQERENFRKNQPHQQQFQSRPMERRFQNNEQNLNMTQPAQRSQNPEGGMQKQKFQGQGNGFNHQPAGGGPGQKRERGGRNSPR